MKRNVLLLILLIFCTLAFSQFKSASYMYMGNTLPYQIMYPENYDETQKYPLLVFLHGAGERGNDNEKQLTHGKQFLLDNFLSVYPSIVIAPQCPTDNYWSNVVRHQTDKSMVMTFGRTDEPTTAMITLVNLIQDWISSGKVDENRVYAGGLSMGGMGTLELLWRMPQAFAAAFPICGGSDLEKLQLYAKNTAVWLFHGEVDVVVSADNSRNIYEKLNELGCDVKYTEYPGVNHNSWDNVFQEKELVSWLFNHTR